MDTTKDWLTLYGKASSYSFYPFDKKNIIGEGGMGRVFVGIDNKTKRKVAIKAIFSELAQRPTIKERGELEAHLQFRHPNLIEMLDFCVTKEGRIHIVSNFVDGATFPLFLRSFTTNQHEKTKTVLSYIQLILDAVSHLHEHNIIHRDIKPDNIMISANNAILMDLGVAKASNGKRLTNAGVIIGTPHYSAPEQIRGEGDKVNPTTDIYAAGITLYELLTGTPPFDGASQFDIMKMQVSAPLPKNPRLSPQVFKVLKKATEKEQFRRYQSALEFKQAIQEIAEKRSLWQTLFS